MNPEDLLTLFSGAPGRSLEVKDILHRAGGGGGQMKSLKRALKELVQSGRLEKEPGHRFRLSRQGQETLGRVVTHPRFGLSVRLDGEPRSAPLPLSAPRSVQLSGGEQVRVRIERSGRRGRSVATLVELLSAKKTRNLGTFRKIGNTTCIETSERSLPPLLIRREDTKDAKDGNLVEYEIVEPRTNTRVGRARVVQVLGRPGDRETELQRILLEAEIPLEFPPEVIAEARAFGDRVLPAELEGREDLRALPFVTIDGETAKDFDDAVYAEKKGETSFRLCVAIADVSHYVRPKSPLDAETRRRATSVYLPDRAIPMLPAELSSELCSLKPQVDRLVLVAEMCFDWQGRRESMRFYRGVIRSAARLTYTQVAAAFDGHPDSITSVLLPDLLRLYKIAQLLFARRIARGAIDLDLPEAEIVFDAQGMPIDVARRPRNDAHRLIEDLMLAANEAVALHFEAPGLPTVYRIHEDPDPVKIEAFLELCQKLGLGVRLKKKPSPKALAKVLEEISGHESGKMLHGLLLRSLAQARYSATNNGHFGLAAPAYLHFTSPIRRYPDLLVHRLLCAHLLEKNTPHNKEDLVLLADESSKAERRAMLAERAAKDLDRCFVAAAHLGRVLTGSISGVHQAGIFVATDSPFLEGLVPIQNLGDDWYEVDTHGASLRGQRTGRTIKLGDPVQVNIVRVDISARRVEMALATQDASELKPRVDRPLKGRNKPPVRRPRARPRGRARKS